MTERLWAFKELERFLRYEDADVRFWAAGRLVRHYPEEATPLLAPYLFDDHEMTPELVANHLGRYGGDRNLEQLTRGVRTLRGAPAARALEALTRLRAPDSIELVRGAFDRRDFDEECWSGIVEALAERSDPGAREALAQFLRRRADWVGTPPILRAALQHAVPGGYRPLLQAWMRSLQWRGAGVAGAGSGAVAEAFRVLMDHLQVDDSGWCFRTTLGGRIDFCRTLKAVESNYDCDLRTALGPATCERIAEALRTGAYEASAMTLVETIRQRALSLERSPGDDLPDRVVEVAAFWADPEVARMAEGLGPHLGECIVGFLLSTVIMMTRYRNYRLEVRRAGRDLGALLPLLEVETSVLLDALSHALMHAVEADGPDGSAGRSAARRRVEERCLAILSSRGPFFPQVLALETLGELGSASAIGEMIDFVGEENSYLYEAAEHALTHLEDALIEPARIRLEAGELTEDMEHSLLVLLSELGTRESLRLVLDHLPGFVEAVGPGDAARWMSLFGARELIEPLRRFLPLDLAQVGQAVLLLGAIHNLRVPEESEIQRAIDDYWKQRPGGESGSEEPGPDDGSDQYVM